MNANTFSSRFTGIAALVLTLVLAVGSFFSLTMTGCSPSAPADGSGDVVDGSSEPTDASGDADDGSVDPVDGSADASVEDVAVAVDAAVEDGSGSAADGGADVEASDVVTSDVIVLDTVDAVLEPDTSDEEVEGF